MRAANL